ncbi:MAG TPA: agmatine deiminase family protein [Blastocatellia bacterium]|nr:agmatine deiminase family protein [Blastocatellia bacterium]
MPETDNQPSLTPRALGYHMPAEWEPHEATWLSWPHKEESWPGNFEPIPGIFVEMVKHLHKHELVRINVADEEFAANVRRSLIKANIDLTTIRFHLNPTNDAWCRDHGPIYIIRENEGGERERAIIDWGYNAWGDKYPPYDLDDVIPTRIARESGEPLFTPGIVMEGGSLDVNGKGTLLTTEACLLNPNRNPHLTKGQIEDYLRDYLGVTNVLWLGDGIVGDDTDGHIDDLTRFTNPGTVVTVIEDDPADENYKPLQENYERLKAMKDQDGKPLRLVALPMPGPVFYEGQRLPASYANFYIANNVVLMPSYRHRNDIKAMETLQKLFKSRRVISIDCRELVWGLGAIHCVTQQQPKI